MKLIKKLALKLLTAPQQWRLDLINQRCVVFVFVRRVVVAIVVVWDSRDGLKRPPNNANTHNNQPITTRRDGGGIREDARPAGGAGGVQCDCFGCDRAQLM